MNLAMANLVDEKLFLALKGFRDKVVSIHIDIAKRSSTQGANFFRHSGHMEACRGRCKGAGRRAVSDVTSALGQLHALKPERPGFVVQGTPRYCQPDENTKNLPVKGRAVHVCLSKIDKFSIRSSSEGWRNPLERRIVRTPRIVVLTSNKLLK